MTKIINEASEEPFFSEDPSVSAFWVYRGRLYLVISAPIDGRYRVYGLRHDGVPFLALDWTKGDSVDDGDFVSDSFADLFSRKARPCTEVRFK